MAFYFASSAALILNQHLFVFIHGLTPTNRGKLFMRSRSSTAFRIAVFFAGVAALPAYAGSPLGGHQLTIGVDRTMIGTVSLSQDGGTPMPSPSAFTIPSSSSTNISAGDYNINFAANGASFTLIDGGFCPGCHPGEGDWDTTISGLSGFKITEFSSGAFLPFTLIGGTFNVTVPNGGAQGFSIAAIPEPATWAMMMVGVSGLGGMLRRRRAICA